MCLGQRVAICSLLILSFLRSHLQLTVRTNNTSFQYTLRNNNNEVRIGRVKAIADGALRLKTNKRKDEKKYGIWSKQRGAISFEVLSITKSPLFLIIGEKSQCRMGRPTEDLRDRTRRCPCRSQSGTNLIRDARNGLPSRVFPESTTGTDGNSPSVLCSSLTFFIDIV